MARVRRPHLVAGAAVVAIAVAAVVYASRVEPADVSGVGTIESASDLPVLAESVPGAAAAVAWLNTDPLGDDDLDRKVVVYDFWTYSCVNCVRTIPWLRSWYERYRADGLEIVGVHSPEFRFERDHDNVARAVDDLDVTWPVALDDGMVVWNQFRNRYWPAKYVTDREGRLRFVHYGEGAYDETERVLRVLLGVDPTSPLATPPGEDVPTAAAGQTPETYLGARRGGDEWVTLDGAWHVDDEYVEATAPGDAIVLRYRAGEVNLVVGNGPGELTVSLDGGPPRRVPIDGDDLYRLVDGDDGRTDDGRTDNGTDDEHELRVELDVGLRAYAFTFGA
jgi:thiol-disulfide isomerase/thioredoxin